MNKLIYHQYWIKCSNCHNESRFPVYEHDGFMLMSNPDNLADVRIVSWDDTALVEISEFVKQFKCSKLESLVPDSLFRKRIINSNLSKLLFEAICDSQFGVKYKFNTSICCPYCLANNNDNYGPTDNPYEVVEAEFSHITHRDWDNLSDFDKENFLSSETIKFIDSMLAEFVSEST